MAPSPTIRRLLRETAELSSASSNPNPAFHAAPVSDADLHEWHFTLVGPPPPSPYAGGLYHGRITLPASYPLKPPNFRFLTPSGRFEVNREICLSISGFHEETWMPAWGVRTALTALRSFMAEQGTAGQVGGLEASAEVRKRLARESRGWKCEACKKTNELIMREWWDTCRSAGVKVYEDMGLEGLPEGMMLEARAPSSQTLQDDEKKKAQQDEPILEQPPTSERPSSSAPSGLPRHNADDPNIWSASKVLSPPSPPIPRVSSPSAEAVQASAEAVLTSLDELHTLPNGQAARVTQPMMASVHTPHLGGTALQQRRRRQESIPTITIDRAITGVFLALCFMVLKKIFYPAGSPGTIDDFYLQRE